MSVFAFIHGAWHGAWCWSMLGERLSARGHTPVAVSLPIEDPEAGASEWASVVVDALYTQAGPDDVIVVGHSLGGTTVPLVAEAVGAKRMVFLTAIMPEIGLSLADIAVRSPESHQPGWAAFADKQIMNPDGSTMWHPDDAIEAFYHDCPPDQARIWANQLRPQQGRAFNEITPLTRWPDVPSSVVVASRDRVLSPEWHAANALERTGEPAIEMDTGHSPMCAEPDQLAAILDQLAMR
jgi:pimeloyl-ACP methyl ester carboxylesterase